MNLPAVHRATPKPVGRAHNHPEERRFYGSRAWRRLSEQVRREEPLCRQCLAEGVTRLADVTDHIVPILRGGDRWDRRNLQPLCRPHHDRKSASEAH